jgi:hypothetical protein
MLFTVCYSFTDLHAILLQGNVNHCTANTTIAYNFQRLEKGVQFAIEDFVVRANKEEYRIRKTIPLSLNLTVKPT